MRDISVRLGSLELKNPVICGSGEHVLTEEGIRAGLKAGAAVVVAKSVNETVAAREQLGRTDYALFDSQWQREPWASPTWATASLLCRSGLQPLPTDAWISRIASLDIEARRDDALVAGSLILADLSEAVSIAVKMRDAGLRLIEFNVGAPYGDEAASGAIVTERAADRVRQQVSAVCSAVDIPVWVKLTGQSENVAALAEAAREGGGGCGDHDRTVAGHASRSRYTGACAQYQPWLRRQLGAAPHLLLARAKSQEAGAPVTPHRNQRRAKRRGRAQDDAGRRERG